MSSYLIPKDMAASTLHAGLALCHGQWVDVLDCSVSFARQRTELKPVDILPQILASESTSYCLILRQAMGSEPAYFELGTRTTLPDGRDYFIYIILTPKKGYELLQQLNLAPIQ